MSTSKRRAQHATKACNSCRRRRCKCDGVHPVCGTCSFYGHECTWSQEEDARRPATKQLVESLRVRIRELEAEVAQLRGSATSSETATRSSLVPSSGGSDHDAKIEAEFPGRSHLTMQEGSITASGPTSMWSTFPVEESSAEPPSIRAHPVKYQYVFHRDPSVPLPLLPRESQLSAQCQWDRHLPKPDGFDQMEHDILLDRCFNFHTPWLRVVEPEYFLQDMLVQLTPISGLSATDANPRTQCYSGFLHCALMSFAAAFSDNPKIRAKSTRKLFADCAKQYLESECERPSLTVVQALTFLSDYHSSFGERGLAYLFFGMSCRVVRALGLCIDSRPWVETGRITLHELTARDWQFWSTFCQDKMMSLDFGRDHDIPLPHLNVNLPKVDETLDAKPWAGMVQDGDKAQPNKTTLAFFECCKLMLIAVRIMDTIYSQGRQNWKVTEKDSVSQIHLLLDSWYNNLPEELLVSSRGATRPLPHVITLNLAYWWLLLLLHRPFYARTQRSASNASTDTPPTSFTELSVKLCDRAANKIVTLVMLFERCYGLKYFPLSMLQVIFMAGATLLVQSATLSESAVKKRADAHDATRKCIRALQVAAQTWECANVSATQLQNLLQEQTGESPIQASYQLQTVSPESSPLNYQPPLPGEPSTQLHPHPHPPQWHNNHSTQPPFQYPPPTIDPTQILPTMFRDFVSQHEENLELGYALHIPATQIPYRGLHQLHQQPLMGMPSGSEFMMSPHMLPLPHDPNYREGGYPVALDVEYYYQQQSSHQHSQPPQGHGQNAPVEPPHPLLQQQNHANDVRRNSLNHAG